MQKIKNSQSQKLRFLLVGTVNTLLDFGIVLIAKISGIPSIPANFLSTTIAFVFSFFANKSYTFRTSGAPIKREVVLFIIITIVGIWVIQPFIIWWLEPLLVRYTEIDTVGALLGAKVIATLVSLVWNYTLYSRVVFTHKESKK